MAITSQLSCIVRDTEPHTGTLVAVVDTGITPERLGPSQVVAGVNLSREGSESDATDGNGHGTLIAATIVRRAAQARVLPVKIMGDYGYLRESEQLEAAFDWILEFRETLRIGVVCASFADASHVTSDAGYRGSRLQRQVAALREAGVPTVAPAGNGYAVNRRWSLQGMAWPAILREVISAGAMKTGPDGLRLTNNTQRLHAELGAGCSTTVFVEPGDPGGTSGAAAVIAGCLANLRGADPNASIDQLVARMMQDAREARDESLLMWPALASP